MYIVYSRGENKCLLICRYFANQSCTFSSSRSLSPPGLDWVTSRPHPARSSRPDDALFLLTLMLFPFDCRDYMNCGLYFYTIKSEERRRVLSVCRRPEQPVLRSRAFSGGRFRLREAGISARFSSELLGHPLSPGCSFRPRPPLGHAAPSYKWIGLFSLRHKLEAQLPWLPLPGWRWWGRGHPAVPAACPLSLRQELRWGHFACPPGSQAGLRALFLEGIAPEGRSGRRGDAGALGSEGGMARGHPGATGRGLGSGVRRAAPRGAPYAGPESSLQIPTCQTSAAEQTCQRNSF